MSLNILVVDDSTVVRKMILRSLELSGLPLGDVYHAANGREGLEALESNWVDLIFADLNMPVMDGQEMIERIRANPDLADVSIVVVSTEGSETRIAHLEQLGTEFIHKPFAPEQIREVVTRRLGITHEQV